ncbi:hypothetical protein PINS_up017217 [Pythium insidiosum]|nr:hypothetical protein PINS_up017217 [Pythium insidiosum]
MTPDQIAKKTGRDPTSAPSTEDLLEAVKNVSELASTDSDNLLEAIPTAYEAAKSLAPIGKYLGLSCTSSRPRPLSMGPTAMLAEQVQQVQQVQRVQQVQVITPAPRKNRPSRSPEPTKERASTKRRARPPQLEPQWRQRFDVEKFMKDVEKNNGDSYKAYMQQSQEQQKKDAADMKKMMDDVQKTNTSIYSAYIQQVQAQQQQAPAFDIHQLMQDAQQSNTNIYTTYMQQLSGSNGQRSTATTQQQQVSYAPNGATPSTLAGMFRWAATDRTATTLLNKRPTTFKRRVSCHRENQFWCLI